MSLYRTRVVIKAVHDTDLVRLLKNSAYMKMLQEASINVLFV